MLKQNNRYTCSFGPYRNYSGDICTYKKTSLVFQHTHRPEDSGLGVNAPGLYRQTYGTGTPGGFHR